MSKTDLIISLLDEIIQRLDRIERHVDFSDIFEDDTSNSNNIDRLLDSFVDSRKKDKVPHLTLVQDDLSKENKHGNIVDLSSWNNPDK